MTGSGRVVVQQKAVFLSAVRTLVGGNVPATAPMAFDWQGFEPPTAKTASGCATIRPWAVVVGFCIPIAWSLLLTNYYTMPWGMLRE